MTHRGVQLEGRPPVAPTPGPAPMLQWLAIDRLVIDDSYQRPLGRGNWTAIEKIAANFRWSRFSPVLAAPIEGGLFAVIDGQHRIHAAALCGLTEVPAMVVQVGIEEQAHAFSWVNSQQIRVSVFHIFKAALAAGDDWAVRAEAAVTGGGCRLMRANASSSLKKPGEVYAVGMIRAAVEAGQDRAISAALAALRAAPSMDRAACYTDFILRPWIGAVAASDCPPHDQLVRALELRNPFKVIEAALASLDRSVPQAVKAREALRQLIARAEVAA
jgi:ParB-like nuclease domain